MSGFYAQVQLFLVGIAFLLNWHIGQYTWLTCRHSVKEFGMRNQQMLLLCFIVATGGSVNLKKVYLS